MIRSFQRGARAFLRTTAPGSLAALLTLGSAIAQPLLPANPQSEPAAAGLPSGFTLQDLPGLMSIPAPGDEANTVVFPGAEPADTPPAQAATANTDAVPPTDSSLRDPFWPVGYEPPPPAPPPGSVDAKLPTRIQHDLVWPEIPMRGRSRAADGAYFILVDGIGVVRTGDDITLRRDGYDFHWRVVGIDANGLQTIRLGVTQPPPTSLR